MKQDFSEKQIVEFTAFCGMWNYSNRLCEALHGDLERPDKRIEFQYAVRNPLGGGIAGHDLRRRAANDRAVRVAVLFENLQFLQPSHEGMCCSVGLFSALRVLHLVQDFIALVDSRSSLLLARKARGIFEIADDPSVLEMQLRREIKLNRHAAETPGCA